MSTSHFSIFRCTDGGEPPKSIDTDFTVYVVDAPAVPKILRYTGLKSVKENEANVTMGHLQVEHAVTRQLIPGVKKKNPVIVQSSNF